MFLNFPILSRKNSFAGAPESIAAKRVVATPFAPQG